MAATSIRLAFSPDPRLLGAVRLVVSAVARRVGVDDEQVEDLKVAISETCSVAISEQRKGGVGAPVELGLQEEGEWLRVEIWDRSPTPATLSTDALSSAGIDERELGHALIAALVNELEVVPRAGGGNATRFGLSRQPGGYPDARSGVGTLR